MGSAHHPWTVGPRTYLWPQDTSPTRRPPAVFPWRGLQRPQRPCPQVWGWGYLERTAAPSETRRQVKYTERGQHVLAPSSQKQRGGGKSKQSRQWVCRAWPRAISKCERRTHRPQLALTYRNRVHSLEEVSLVPNVQL